MNFEKLLGQQASKNLKCNPFQSSLSCFKRLFTFSVSPPCFTQFNGSFHRVVWFFSEYLASNSWKNFRHSGIVLSPWKSSETMRIAFVTWRFCRTHYWAAKPQKRARTTMRNIRSGYIDSFVSLLINRESTTGIVCITDYTLKFAPFVCFLCTSRFSIFKSIFFPIRVYLSCVNLYKVEIRWDRES